MRKAERSRLKTSSSYTWVRNIALEYAGGGGYWDMEAGSVRSYGGAGSAGFHARDRMMRGYREFERVLIQNVSGGLRWLARDASTTTALLMGVASGYNGCTNSCCERHVGYEDSGIDEGETHSIRRQFRTQPLGSCSHKYHSLSMNNDKVTPANIRLTSTPARIRTRTPMSGEE